MSDKPKRLGGARGLWLFVAALALIYFAVWAAGKSGDVLKQHPVPGFTVTLPSTTPLPALPTPPTVPSKPNFP